MGNSRAGPMAHSPDFQALKNAGRINQPPNFSCVSANDLMEEYSSPNKPGVHVMHTVHCYHADTL